MANLGVGWQTMPVSFMVYNEQVSFLRFCVREGKNFRSHPSQDFHSAYLNPALFKEDCLPDPETISTQRDNILIVQRNIKNVANSAAEVLDEWKIPRFKGKIHRLPSNLYTQITSTVSVTHSVPEEIWIKNVTNWTVLENKHSYIAILALSYIDYGSETAKTSDLEINEGENELRLTRVFYRGEEKYLRQHRFDNAWVILAFGSKISLEELNEQLQHCEIKDQDIPITRFPETICLW